LPLGVGENGEVCLIVDISLFNFFSYYHLGPMRRGAEDFDNISRYSDAFLCHIREKTCYFCVAKRLT
jgi:hypothetical protein